MSVEPDTKGVDALSGHSDGSLLPPRIWLELQAELGLVPAAPHIDPFDDGPWRQLPPVEELEYLWSTPDQLFSSMIHNLGVAAHGEGEDLPRYMASQRRLADWELELKRAREAHSAEEARDDDDGAAGGVAAVVSADAGGGGVDFSGGPENGDAVGEGGQVSVDTHGRRPPKVSRKRRPGQPAAAGG